MLLFVSRLTGSRALRKTSSNGAAWGRSWSGDSECGNGRSVSASVAEDILKDVTE